MKKFISAIVAKTAKCTVITMASLAAVSWVTTVAYWFDLIDYYDTFTFDCMEPSEFIMMAVLVAIACTINNVWNGSNKKKEEKDC